MRALARDLKVASVESEKDFYLGLLEAGEIVAERARENASFSSRIPGSLRVRRRGTTVKILAGGNAAPEAAPLEHHGRAGSFRHPVFGNTEVWVDQPAHPFLTPAAVETEPAVVAVIDKHVDKAFSRLGF